MVVGFVRGHWVHWGAPLWSSGSFVVDNLIEVHRGGHQVYPGSLDSLGCALGVVGFIRGCGVHCDAPWGLSVHPVCLAHWASPWGASGSFGVAGIIGVHSGCRRTHPVSPGSFAHGLTALFIGVRPGDRPVRRGSLGYAIGVVGFIWGPWVN